jgi:DNA helicase HerA-like ATPase
MSTTTLNGALTFEDNEVLGRVQSVDTANIVLKVDDLDKLQRLQVNRLIAIRMDGIASYLIGIVDRIRRSGSIEDAEDLPEPALETNAVKAVLVGTFRSIGPSGQPLFRRNLDQVASIDAEAFALEGDHLTKFMHCIASETDTDVALRLGVYALDESAEALLDGNRLFQRHAVIVGSTGSGKSWATAHLLECIAELPSGNALVFDMHGEYGSLEADAGIAVYRVASPRDIGNGLGLDQGVLHFPYWMFGYEALRALLVERSGDVAVVQASLFAQAVGEAKKTTLTDAGATDLLAQFTLDSPVPFDLDAVAAELETFNGKVPGEREGTLKNGDYTGKLTKLLDRIKAKREDRRFGFLFSAPPETLQLSWLARLARVLLTNEPIDGDVKRRVRIVDFSEVPADVLPLVVSLVAELVFRLKQWGRESVAEPISLFCDEAHLYIPEPSGVQDELSAASLATFERIAKEGRKYGVGLVVISQRPSEVNRTILSQSNNYIAMRLLNADDRSVIRALLPDSLGRFSELLQVLDVGEAVVVGDASLLPSRVRIAQPRTKPKSGTVQFWSEWNEDRCAQDIDGAVNAWRKQTVAQ